MSVDIVDSVNWKGFKKYPEDYDYDDDDDLLWWDDDKLKFWTGTHRARLYFRNGKRSRDNKFIGVSALMTDNHLVDRNLPSVELNQIVSLEDSTMYETAKLGGDIIAVIKVKEVDTENYFRTEAPRDIREAPVDR